MFQIFLYVYVYLIVYTVDNFFLFFNSIWHHLNVIIALCVHRKWNIALCNTIVWVYIVYACIYSVIHFPRLIIFAYYNFIKFVSFHQYLTCLSQPIRNFSANQIDSYQIFITSWLLRFTSTDKFIYFFSLFWRSI